MPGKRPKTLGGWVIAQPNGGVRVWWHVQRLLICWGLTREELGREPIMEEVYEWADRMAGYSESTIYRDHQFYRKVFEVPVGDLYEAIRKNRHGAPEDLVLTAPVTVLGLAL